MTQPPPEADRLQRGHQHPGAEQNHQVQGGGSEVKCRKRLT